MLNVVIGQRLARKICRQCKIAEPISPQLRKQLISHVGNSLSGTFWKGTGCDACRYTGYSGRVGLFEILVVTSALKELISARLTTSVLKEAAEKEGFQSMAVDGIEKAISGITTIDEVLRSVPFESPGIRGVRPAQPARPQPLPTIDNAKKPREVKKNNADCSQYQAKKGPCD